MSEREEQTRTDPWVRVIRSTGRKDRFSEDPVRDYLRALSRTPLLTAEEEVDLGRRIEVGVLAADKLGERGLAQQLRKELEWLARDGEWARERMVTANLRLVVSIAKRYPDRGLPLLDLIQEGNIGLIIAVKKFDFQAGFKFSTYSSWWIKQCITRALADTGRTIRIPVHTAEKMSAIARQQRELAIELGRDATMAEIAEAVDLPVEKVIDLIEHGRSTVSLQTPIGDEEGELGDVLEDTANLSPFDATAASAQSRHLARSLTKLSSRERSVLEMRYGLAGTDPMTFSDIGRTVKLSCERVRQIHRRALDTLREEPLRDYLTA